MCILRIFPRLFYGHPIFLKSLLYNIRMYKIPQQSYYFSRQISINKISFAGVSVVGVFKDQFWNIYK